MANGRLPYKAIERAAKGLTVKRGRDEDGPYAQITNCFLVDLEAVRSQLEAKSYVPQLWFEITVHGMFIRR